MPPADSVFSNTDDYVDSFLGAIQNSPLGSSTNVSELLREASALRTSAREKKRIALEGGEESLGEAFAQAMITALPVLVGGSSPINRVASSAGGIAGYNAFESKSADRRERSQRLGLEEAESDEAEAKAKEVLAKETLEGEQSLNKQLLSSAVQSDMLDKRLAQQMELSDKRMAMTLQALGQRLGLSEESQVSIQANRLAQLFQEEVSKPLEGKLTGISEMDTLMSVKSDITAEQLKVALRRAIGDYHVSNKDVANTIPQNLLSKIVALENWIDGGTDSTISKQQYAVLGELLRIQRSKANADYYSRKREFLGKAPMIANTLHGNGLLDVYTQAFGRTIEDKIGPEFSWGKKGEGKKPTAKDLMNDPEWRKKKLAERNAGTK